MLRRTIGNPDTTMHHDKNATQMLQTLMQSQWLSMPCLMKNEAIICATGSASIASNLDMSLTNAQRSDPQMQGTLVQDACATMDYLPEVIKELSLELTMLLTGNPMHPRRWVLKNSTNTSVPYLKKNERLCLIWQKQRIMIKALPRRIFPEESSQVCSCLSYIWYSSRYFRYI